MIWLVMECLVFLRGTGFSWEPSLVAPGGIYCVCAEYSADISCTPEIHLFYTPSLMY